MGDIVGMEIGKGIKEGIEEYLRQDIWQSEVDRPERHAFARSSTLPTCRDRREEALALAPPSIDHVPST